jgi:hypothetical protein
MPPVPPGPWFNKLARFLGPAYLRNAFTKRGGYKEVPTIATLPGDEAEP